MKKEFKRKLLNMLLVIFFAIIGFALGEDVNGISMIILLWIFILYDEIRDIKTILKKEDCIK